MPDALLDAVETTPATTDKTYFRLSVASFKEQEGIDKMDVIKSPKHPFGLFLAADNGERYNVQQSIDFDKEVEMLQVTENGEEGVWCMVQKSANNVVASF